MTTANQRVMLVDAESSVEANVDDSGYLEVSIKAGGGTGGTAMADDAAFTAGTTNVTPIGGVFTADTVDAGDTGALAMDASRRLLVSIEVDNVGIGGGTQYTEGDTDSTITGNALMFESNTTTHALSVVNNTTPLPISDAGGSITVDGTFWQATQPISAAALPLPTGAATAANQLADGHNVVVTSAPTTAVTGTFWQATQPVSLASVPSHAVTNAGTFAVQSDTELTTADLDIGAGTDTRAVIGLVGSKSGGGEIIPGSATDGLLVNLGTNNDVTVTSGAITETNSAALAVVGGGAEATALRVTLANDSTGLVSVDGTVTANLSATDNTVLDNIDTSLNNLEAALKGPAAPTIDSYTHAAINLAAAADQVLVASAVNKQIWVYGISFVVNVAGTISFQDEDNVAITGIMPFAANSGMAIPPSGNFAMPIWKLGTDKDLEVDVVTSEIDGYLDYAIVSV